MNFYVEDLEAILKMLKTLNDSEFAMIDGSPYAIPVQSIHDESIIGYFVDEVGDYSFLPAGSEWFRKVSARMESQLSSNS